MSPDPIIAIIPAVGDAPSRALAERLRRRAREVPEPQRSRMVETMPNTLFISHTSADDAFIKGADEDDRLPNPVSIWWIAGRHFHDPFYHSFKTGGAEDYERTVGLALLASTRVLVVWSKNALRSDYVRAEILIATEGAERLTAYVAPDAPQFPIAGVRLIYDLRSLGPVIGFVETRLTIGLRRTLRTAPLTQNVSWRDGNFNESVSSHGSGIRASSSCSSRRGLQ